MERQKTFINIVPPDSAREEGHLTEKANSFYEKYTLEDKIGEGANGFVYRCLFKPSGKHYAVKIQSIS
jgi:serine/threonine protein kinase